MFSDLLYRLRALFRRDAMERELLDELQFHLEREAGKREGAARQARADFGGLEQVKEACRDERGIGTIDRARQDLRYGWRMFARHPAFTIAVVGTLGLGLGGATTMFGVVDGVLLKPLPYRDADRIVRIGRSFGGVRVSAASAADYAALSGQARTLSHVAVARTETVDVSGGAAPERVEAAVVSASYFDVLGIVAAAGQPFVTGDDRPGGRQVAVIADALWRRRLAADSGAIGQAILINGQPHTIVGIMPRHFRGPEVLGQQDVGVWLPLGRLKLSSDPDDASLDTIASIAAGFDLAPAIQEIDRIGGPTHFWTALLRADTIGDVASSLWLLWGAVSLLLVIACTNIANLFLVRATDRTREIAVRTAMGAGRGRIARQLMTETLLFGAAGGALGAGLSYGGIALVRVWAPADLPRINDLHVDVRVLAFAFVVAFVAGLIFGLAPARTAGRSDFAGILRGASAGVTAGRAPVRQRGAFVILQTALASMLVVGAALLANSALRLARVDPGFDPANVAWIDVALPERAYPGAAPKVAFFDDLLRSVHGVPGVESVSLVQGRPLGGGNSVSTVAPEGRLPADGDEPARVPYHVVAPGYFGALRIPRLDGRDFTDADRGTSPRVAIVSRTFASRFWPGESAVGKRFWMGRVAADAPLVEVVGVVEDVRQYGLADAPSPIVYRALAQVPRGTATLIARHDGLSPIGVIDRLRAATWNLDSTLPLDRAGTMEAQISRSIREPRFRALALSAFSSIACAIAAVGLYGALAGLVRARTRELGIRIALGAEAASLHSIVIYRGMLFAATGVAIGLAGAVACSRFLASMTFGITPTDVPTLAFAAVAMLAVALAASWRPARMAARVDPVAILRD